MPNVHPFPYDHVPYDQIAISKPISQWSIDDWDWDFIYPTIPTIFHTHPYAMFVCLFVCLNVDNVSVINHLIKILDYWRVIIMLSNAPTIVHPHLCIYIYLIIFIVFIYVHNVPYDQMVTTLITYNISIGNGQTWGTLIFP